MNACRTLVLLSLPVALLVTAGPASAAIPAGAPVFGAHVSSCLQVMGFGGTHNPGMHRGAAGCDGVPC